MQTADRLKNLGTETAFEVLAKAKAMEARGIDVVHMEIGEPDFDTPRFVRDAAKKALDEGQTHYTQPAGLIAVREAFADYIAKTRNVACSPDEVVVTSGGKPMIFYGLQTTINPGDEVIHANPAYPIYESVIRYLGAVPVPVPLR